MLFLTLALSMAMPVATPAPDPQRYRKASSSRRTARARRAPPKKVQMRLTSICGVSGTCRADPNRQYRLTGASETVVDAKGREVERIQSMPCGTTGAPVCPSNGQTLVRAGIN